MTAEIKTRPPSFWWVNLGKTHRWFRERGELWAGTELWHHRNMRDLRPGDIVLAYANQALQGFCVITEEAQEVDQHTTPDRPDLQPARRLVAKMKFYDFQKPIQLDEIPGQWRLENTTAHKGPFQRNGNVHQIYLGKLHSSFYKRLHERFRHVWPADGPKGD